MTQEGPFAFASDRGRHVIAQGGFFYLCFKYLSEEVGALSHRDVRAWCRSLKGLNGSLPQWVIALKHCASQEQALEILREHLGEGVSLAGEGVFLAFIRRRWALGRLNRERIGAVFMALSQESSPRVAAGLTRPAEMLESIDPGASPQARDALVCEVDRQLLAFFQDFEPFDALIPKTLW